MLPLTDKIKLINDLIKENRDATIRDYLDVVKDIELVMETTKNTLTTQLIKERNDTNRRVHLHQRAQI